MSKAEAIEDLLTRVPPTRGLLAEARQALEALPEADLAELDRALARAEEVIAATATTAGVTPERSSAAMASAAARLRTARETVSTGPSLVTDRAVLDRETVATGRLRGADSEVIQVVEERLRIGKRSVKRGKVRIHTSVVSREVSEDIALHAETVTVVRRVVDRPIPAAALDIDPFRERTIEMEEIDEAAVVAKSAHVIEEIAIRKTATDRVETVHDTLRSTKVDIEDGRTVTGSLGRFAEEIRNDMEVVGSDGAHVGTVDHMDGGRIKLKIDPLAGGMHHYLEPSMVKSVAGRVMLAVTAAAAKARWAEPDLLRTP